MQRWQSLEKISVIGVPVEAQVQLLAHLPALRELHLDARAADAEAAELERGLPNVRVHVRRREFPGLRLPASR